MLGLHPLDASRALRTQQGIVWENLSREKAAALASLLIETGFPSGLVPQHDVVKLAAKELCRNADVVEGGLEIEDGHGHKRLLHRDWFELAHVGWVKEQERSYRERTRAKIRIKTGARGDRRRQTVRVEESSAEEAGWVLNLFGHGDPSEWIQIHAPYFNYDYLPETPPSWREGFRLFMNDLYAVIPGPKTDAGFRLALSLGACDTVPDAAKFPSVDDLDERGRWALTILRTVGELA